MNFELIGCLIGLRYKLLWAKTRTRNGKVALFMAGYLLLVAVIALLAAGGFGAGVVAVRSGKAEQIAQGVLTGLFVWAIITSVMLGFGMNAVFSDFELRRYPLKAQERRFARYFTGIADPFWFLCLALDLGLAVGLYLYGASNLFLALLAVLLLYPCNYLAAQLTGVVLDRIMQRRGGSVLLPLLIFALCVLPGTLVPVFQKNRSAGRAILQALGFTPGFAAGSLMARTDSAALYGFGLLVCWLVGLAAALIAMERQPARVRAAQSTRIQWDTPFQRIGALFGPKYGPLAAHWLLFYSRCKRLRISYLMSVPLFPFLLLVWTKQGGKSFTSNPFAAAVGIFAICGLAPAASCIVNIYGYVGGGFRRYFLLPGDPAASLRAASYVLLIMCVPPLLLATLAWMAFPPTPYDARAIAMLLASGVAGTFFFQGAGLWTSLYGPRRGNPASTMGNDLSAAGNLVVVGGMMAALFVPRIIASVYKRSITPDYWWVAVIVAVVAGVFYFASLRGASSMLVVRREKLLAIVEGKA